MKKVVQVAYAIHLRLIIELLILQLGEAENIESVYDDDDNIANSDLPDSENSRNVEKVLTQHIQDGDNI